MNTPETLHTGPAPQRSGRLPTELGRRLTAAREKRGLSLEDAAHETRIQPRRLALLEAGNIAAFGGVTYARSFLRAYGAFLEVDCSACLQALPEKGVLGGPRDYRYLTHTQGAWLRLPENGPELRQVPQRPAIRRIPSPIPAGLAVFALMLATTAMWGRHLVETRPGTPPALAQAADRRDAPPQKAPARRGPPALFMAAAAEGAAHAGSRR